MPNRVICRSDHDYLGYPLAFYWQDQRLEINQVVARSRTPTGYTFKVSTAELGFFELVYNMDTDQWSVDRI